MIYRFICLKKQDYFYFSSKKTAIKLNVPDFVDPSNEVLDRVLDHLMPVEGYNRHDYVLVEDDCDYGIDWDRVDPVWLSDPKTWDEFSEYVDVVCGDLKNFEHLIFNNNAELVDGSWVLTQEDDSVYHRISHYMYRCDNKRMRRFENIISEDEEFSERYIKNIRVDWADWTIEEVMRSPVWMYEYCSANGFDEQIYSAMMCLSFSSDSLYVKKFMNTKRFVPRNVRKNISSKKDFLVNLIKQNGWTHVGSRSLRRECLNRGMDIGLNYITQCRRKVASGEW